MAAPRKVTVVKEPEGEVVDGVPEEEEAEAEEVAAETEEEEEYDSEKMDPEVELWDDGPTFAQINAWKQQHGDVFVTSVSPERHYVWRTISRFEYRNIVKMTEQAVSTGQVTQAEANLNNEESIASLCILFPEYNRANNAKEMAGLASTVSQQVMEASAFVAVEVRQL